MTDLDVTTTDMTHTSADSADAASDRRRLLRNLALGGAGAAIGAVALSDTASAGDSGGVAVGGNALELGETATNTSDSPTTLTFTGTDDLTESSLLTVGVDAPNETDGNNVFPGAVGGYGKGAAPTGVHGSTVNPAGFGVVAAHLAPPVADDAEDAAPAALAVASAGGPQVRFVQLPDAVSGPTTGVHSPGELYVDADGTLWFTVPVPLADDAPDDAVPETRFVKLAGSPTSGAFHFLPQPVRLLDTREAGDDDKPAASSSTIVEVTDDDPETELPAGTTGVQLNVTAVRTENDGYFSVGRADVEIPDDATFASGNWFTDDQIINANVTSAVSPAGEIQVKLGPTGGSHLVVDLVAYYL